MLSVGRPSLKTGRGQCPCFRWALREPIADSRQSIADERRAQWLAALVIERRWLWIRSRSGRGVCCFVGRGWLGARWPTLRLGVEPGSGEAIDDSGQDPRGDATFRSDSSARILQAGDVGEGGEEGGAGGQPAKPVHTPTRLSI
jgi:hypothetical protein